MRIPLWRVLIFAIIIVLATYAVFPGESDMLNYYIRAGRIQEASRLLPNLLRTEPSPRNMELAARVYQDLGRPDKAISLMREVVQKKPTDTEALSTLARYLEWDLRTGEAAEVYEKLAVLQPRDVERLEWLISHYRLTGEQNKEGLDIARIVPRLREKAAAMPGTFLPLLWEELMLLSSQRMKHGSAPLRDYLLRGLFVLWQQYELAVEEGDKPEQRTYITFAMEYFVDADAMEQGGHFAAALDAYFRAGVENRLLLGTVMRWRGLDNEAAEYLASIEQEAPNDLALLMAVAQAAKKAGRMSEATDSLQEILRKEPDNVQAGLELARLRAVANDYDQSMDILEKILRSSKSSDARGPVLREMLAVGEWSKKPELMRRALRAAEKHPIQDPEIQRAEARLYLALNETDQALEIEKKLAEHQETAQAQAPQVAQPGPPTEDQESKSLAVLKSLDKQTLRLMAEFYLGAERAGKAFPLLLLVARHDDKGSPGEQASDLLLLLQAALYSTKPENIAQAMELVAASEAAHPQYWQDQNTLLLLAQSYMALNQPEKAIPIFRKLAQSQGGGEGLDAIIDAAVASGKEELVDMALAFSQEMNGLTTSRKRRLAEAYLATEKPDKAFPLLEEIVREEKKAEDLVRLLEAAGFSNDAKLAERAAAVAENMFRADPKARAVAGDQLLSLYLWTGQELKAAHMLEERARREPRNLALLLHAAQAYSFADEPEKSLEFYKRALELQPENPKILAKVAEYASYANDTEAMVRAYEKLQQKGLLGRDGRLALARTYADAQEWEQALPLLTPLLEEERLPQYEGMLLARALVKNEKDEESTLVYDRLARENEDDVPYLSHLGAEALYDDQQSVALGLFERVLRLAPLDARALKGKAMIEAENNDAPSAIQTYNLYNKAYPDDPEARFQLAELYAIEEYPDEAAKQYEKVLQTLRRKGSARPPSASSRGRATATVRGAMRREAAALGNREARLPEPPATTAGADAREYQRILREREAASRKSVLSESGTRQHGMPQTGGPPGGAQ